MQYLLCITLIALLMQLPKYFINATANRIYLQNLDNWHFYWPLNS